MRIAFFSPLNPLRTGISDYSEELLPALADLLDIDIVTDDYIPSNPEIVKRFRILKAREFEHRLDHYDAALYHVGNNYHNHSYMIRFMQRLPGVVVLHDHCLSYLVLGLTLGRGDIRTLTAVLRRDDRVGARKTALRLLLSLVDPYDLSLSKAIVQMNLGLIVHNAYTMRRVQAEIPGKSIKLIPHAIAIHDESRSKSELRAALGLDRDALLVASVSRLSYNKRLEILLSALRNLRAKHPWVKFLVMSDGPLGSRVRALIQKLDLENVVIQTGWVSRKTYLDLIRASDIVVDSRYPSAGETSGSILRAMEAGKPLVVGDHGFFSELPNDFAIKIPIDGREEETLTESLGLLLADETKRRVMGAAARDYVLSNLTWERAAQSYASFLERLSTKEQRSSIEVWPRCAPTSLERTVIRSLFRLFRIGYLYRHYGVSDTLKRIRGERVLFRKHGRGELQEAESS